MEILKYWPIILGVFVGVVFFFRTAYFKPMRENIDSNTKRIVKLEETTGQVRVYLERHKVKLDHVVKSLDDAVKKLDRIAEGKK